MEAKHTPTPWEIDYRDDGKANIVHYRNHPETGTPQPQLIATVATRSSETDYNARLIVEACNNYDALKSENTRLREALEKMITRAIMKYPHLEKGDGQKDLEEARALLKA